MEQQVKLINMATVPIKEIKWLWKPYIPFGKLTIIEGNPGEGKTTFALYIASLLSLGKQFDGTENIEAFEPMNIIYQTAEDGLDDTVKVRLVSAGADCSKIDVIDDREKALSMDDTRLEIAIKMTGAKLLILDPLQAYLGDKVNMNNANEVRAKTKMLSALAQRTGCAIILVGHLNKGTGAKAAYRGIGSIDFYAVARSVLLVGKVPDDEAVRAVVQIKNNLAFEGESMAFRLDKSGFSWIGEYEISADELLSEFRSDFSCGDKTKTAEDFLRKILGNGESVPTSSIFAQAKAIGIKNRTMESVKRDLGIISIKDGKSWYWKMP